MPLSDVERKVLYFSETDWTLPDIMAVNAAFERDYADTEYEEKIAALVRTLQERAAPEEQEAWDDAAVKLTDGDHYLTVLIDVAAHRASFAPKLGKLGLWLPSLDSGGAKRPPGDLRRLILVALLIFIVIFVAGILKASSH